MNSINSIFRFPGSMPPAAKFVAGGGILAAVITFCINFFRSRAQHKDYSDPFPPEVKYHIICMLEKNSKDLKALIALGGVNTAWRDAVDDVCRTKLKAVFGEDFEEGKRAISWAAELWAPLQPKTSKLATLLPEEKSGVITSQMIAVLKAIQSGTIDELRQRIENLEDKTELTTLRFCKHRLQGSINPLHLAVESGDIEKVRLLISCGVPIGVGEDGVIFYNDEPLIEALVRGERDILELLLENGASFSVRVGCERAYYLAVDRALILALSSICSMSVRSNSIPNKKILECVALAMRSLKNGFRADKELTRQAGYLLVNPYCHLVAKLLMLYGVVPKIKDYMLPLAVETSIAIGNIKHLEYLSNQGWMNFKEFRLRISCPSKRSEHQNSNPKMMMKLTDCAYMFGQFEVEKYLVDERQVSYMTSEIQRKSLLETNISKAMSTMMLENSSNEDRFKYVFTIGPSGQKCDWKRLLEIVDHYNIEIGAVALASPWEAFYTIPILGMYQALLVETQVYGVPPSSDETRVYNEQKTLYRFKHALFLLQVIEDLANRGANLDSSRILRGLLENLQEEFTQNGEIINKINSLINK